MSEQKDYKPEITSLLQALEAAGFSSIEVDNGGGWEAFDTIEEAVEDIVAVDEAFVTLLSPKRINPYLVKKVSLFLVLGNSPGELVCDYTYIPELEAVIDKHSKEWEGRPQPMIVTQET